MHEKLSVKNIYLSAFRYVFSHPGAIAFLTIFYYLGSLMPMFVSTKTFFLLMLPYYYLFIYFAAGCYYKQKILWDKQIFIAAGIRFITTVFMLLAVIALSNYLINLGFDFISSSFIGGKMVTGIILNSAAWKIIKSLFMFVLVVFFFVIPSFAFVSEISGKSRSFLTTYVKTKGNFIQISLVIFIAFLTLIAAIWVLRFFSPLIAEFIRDVVLVFDSIVYFKVYDFFYYPTNKKSSVKTKKNNKPEPKEILSAQADTSKNAVVEKNQEIKHAD